MSQPNPQRNLGARAERRANLKTVRTRKAYWEAEGSKTTGADQQAALLCATEMGWIEAEIMGRSKRTAHRKGGLGRK